MTVEEYNEVMISVVLTTLVMTMIVVFGASLLDFLRGCM